MRTVENKYPVIVLGATFAGIGAAYADRENTLIIERSSLVGYEFINCFRTGAGWLESKLSAEGERLRGELLERKILKKDGKVYISEVAPVLYNRFIKDNINILLMSDIVSISSKGSVFEIEVYNAGGFSRFIANKIIDTRPENISPDSVRSKSINAMLLSSDNAIFPEIHHPKASFDRTEQGTIMRFNLDATDNWFTARRKLHEFWAERPSELKPWQILAVAQVFDIRPNAGLCAHNENLLSINSAFFENPLEAFEEGYNRNLKQ